MQVVARQLATLDPAEPKWKFAEAFASGSSADGIISILDVFMCPKDRNRNSMFWSGAQPLRNRRVLHRAIEIESEDSQYEASTKIVFVGL
jgi:hypothetical protein